MANIKLKDYLLNKQLVVLFDILIKQHANNRDLFLENIDIAPSTYRRIKFSKQNIGNKTIEILCEYFDIKNIIKEEIYNSEMYLNKIYQEIYYKSNDNCLLILGHLETLINEKDILFPVYMLFKLFVLTISHQVNIISNEYDYLYEEVKKYKNYFTDELLEIYAYIEIKNNEPVEKINLHSQNGLIFQTIANKYYDNEKFIESLFYTTKAKEIFSNDQNFKRQIEINLLIMSNYCSLKNYDKYYELALSLYFVKDTFIEFYDVKDLISKHFAISLVANKKYNELEYYFKKRNNLTLTEIICLLIAKYNTNKNEYYKYYNNVFDLLRDDQRNITIKTINDYLVKNDKKILKNNMKGINKDLIEVLLN